MAGKRALRSGSGCMLGDIAAEWLAVLIPCLAVWFGWHLLFSETMYSVREPVLRARHACLAQS